MRKGNIKTIFYPNMKEQLSSIDYLGKLMGHFDMCKDICDDFGTYTMLIPKMAPGHSEERSDVEGFIIKSYKTEEADAAISGLDETGGFKFTQGYDPFWDDDLEIDPSYFEDEEDHKDGGGDGDDDGVLLPEIENEVPDNDQEIVETSKRWVAKLMSDCGVCPFTSGGELAGLPLGNVRYNVERCTTLEETYAEYWKEVVLLQKASSEKVHSTTLLITPNFALHNIELFENFSVTLTRILEPLQIEDLVQLVFFHPLWTFRDGMGDRMGKDRSANYARRSPWPMINLLRTTQVRAAQRGIPTGLVYQQNEKTLGKIGADSMEKMLRLRDWDELSNYKVDRKDMEALRIAKDWRETDDGGFDTLGEDLSLGADSALAVNRVDEGSVDGGDMVNIIRQALDKRLDGVALTGPETSATLMATDFLMGELYSIIDDES